MAIDFFNGKITPEQVNLAEQLKTIENMPINDLLYCSPLAFWVDRYGNAWVDGCSNVFDSCEDEDIDYAVIIRTTDGLVLDISHLLESSDFDEHGRAIFPRKDTPEGASPIEIVGIVTNPEEQMLLQQILEGYGIRMDLSAEIFDE